LSAIYTRDTSSSVVGELAEQPYGDGQGSGKRDLKYSTFLLPNIQYHSSFVSAYNPGAKLEAAMCVYGVGGVISVPRCGRFLSSLTVS
jgi:hypothetical protein